MNILHLGMNSIFMQTNKLIWIKASYLFRFHANKHTLSINEVSMHCKSMQTGRPIRRWLPIHSDYENKQAICQWTPMHSDSIQTNISIWTIYLFIFVIDIWITYFPCIPISYSQSSPLEPITSYAFQIHANIQAYSIIEFLYVQIPCKKNRPIIPSKQTDLFDNKRCIPISSK